jgi:tol-pal system protein YbgF
LTAALISAGLSVPGLAQEGGDSVASRLGRLEQKVRDLQVTLGTIQSFSGKPAAVLAEEAPPEPQAAPGEESLGARMEALETQITALTRHVEHLGRQMSALEAKLSALPVPPAPRDPAYDPAQDDVPPLRQGEAPLPPENAGRPLPLGRDAAPAVPDMPTASVSVPPEAQDDDPSKPRWFGPKPGTEEFAALAGRQAALPGIDARSLYQQGYGAILQKDYAAAEDAFRQLIDSHPDDPLAGDAQYWIGETYYLRGQYKKAADAFLTGYKKYKSGQKAPDSLLKLAMSLAELGQKEAACSTLDELKTKYPQAPKDVSDEAKIWREKTGC